MSFQQTLDVSGDVLTLPIPEEFKGASRLTVIIQKPSEEEESYDEEMERASRDPLFTGRMNRPPEEDDLAAERIAFAAEMEAAANDPLFQADVTEVMEDFKWIDREHFGEEAR